MPNEADSEVGSLAYTHGHHGKIHNYFSKLFRSKKAMDVRETTAGNLMINSQVHCVCVDVITSTVCIQN